MKLILSRKGLMPRPANVQVPHESHAYLQSVGRGQEFVLDTLDYPEAIRWAEDLIAKNAV